MYSSGINTLASLLDEPHRHSVLTQALTSAVIRCRSTQRDRCSEDSRILDIRSHPMLGMVDQLAQFQLQHVWSAG